MWLFTKKGFFSAVQHKDDATRILIRARFKGDLERLFKANGVLAKVSFDSHADYAYRAVITRETFVYIAKREAESIDYTNFKSAAHDGTRRDAAYMDVWGVMFRAQENQQAMFRGED